MGCEHYIASRDDMGALSWTWKVFGTSPYLRCLTLLKHLAGSFTLSTQSAKLLAAVGKTISVKFTCSFANFRNHIWYGLAIKSPFPKLYFLYRQPILKNRPFLIKVDYPSALTKCQNPSQHYSYTVPIGKHLSQLMCRQRLFLQLHRSSGMHSWHL